jgi:hypothetical protein
MAADLRPVVISTPFARGNAKCLYGFATGELKALLSGIEIRL